MVSSHKCYQIINYCDKTPFRLLFMSVRLSNGASFQLYLWKKTLLLIEALHSEIFNF